MQSKFRMFLFRLWPPYEARIADQSIERRIRGEGEEKRWEAILTEVRNTLPKNDKLEELERFANQIKESEAKRKEIIESKATSLITGIGIGVGIISIIPLLFSERWLLPTGWAIVSGFAYLLAMICLFVAAYYAVKVRRVGGFALPSYAAFLDLLRTHQGKIEERIVLTLAQTRWNEELLLSKANYLSAAEELFLRGLALLAFAAVISIGTRLLLN